MRQYGRGLMVVESVEEVVEDNDVSTLELQTEITEGNEELKEDQSELEGLTSDIESGTQAADELEAIQEVVESSVESGKGLSEEAAEMASIAIESIRNKLGCAGNLHLVPAMESFANANTRMASTKLVQEKISDFLINIWRSIREAIGKVVDVVLEIVRKIRAQVPNLKKMKTELEKKLKAKTSDRTKSDMLTSGQDTSAKTLGLVDSIGINGECNYQTASIILLNSANSLSLSSELNGDIERIMEMFKKSFNSEMTRDDFANISEKSSAINDSIEKHVEKVFATQGKQFNRNKDLNELIDDAFGVFGGGEKFSEKDWFGPLVGNKYFTIKKFKSTEAGLLEFNFIASMLSNVARKEGKVSVQALSKSAIEELLKDVDTLLTAVEKIDGSSTATRRSLIRMTEFSDSMIKWLEKKARTEMKNAEGFMELQIGMFKKQTRYYLDIIQTTSVTLPGMAVRAATSALTYASLSIDNIE